MAQSEDGSARFWEFYALRYSVGAVLGALILFVLVKQNEPLASLIFIKHGEPIDVVQVGIFLGIGLVYSYLSSAPILVFHAGRFLIPGKHESLCLISRCSVIVFLVLSIAPAALFMTLSSMGQAPKNWLAVVIFFASSVITIQFQIVFKCCSQRSRLFLFYKYLSINRSAAKGGMVDSYRHLREHGNAFGIVFFEIMLAIFIFVATMYSSLSSPGYHPISYETITILTIVLVLWITPASFVWVVACMVERDFVDS